MNRGGVLYFLEFCKGSVHNFVAVCVKIHGHFVIPRVLNNIQDCAVTIFDMTHAVPCTISQTVCGNRRRAFCQSLQRFLLCMACSLRASPSSWQPPWDGKSESPINPFLALDCAAASRQTAVRCGFLRWTALPSLRLLAVRCVFLHWTALSVSGQARAPALLPPSYCAVCQTPYRSMPPAVLFYCQFPASLKRFCLEQIPLIRITLICHLIPAVSRRVSYCQAACRYFPHKAADRIVLHLSSDHARLCISDGQILLGARDTHISKASLLLNPPSPVK